MKHISNKSHTISEILETPDLISTTYTRDAIYEMDGIIRSSFQRGELLGTAHVDVLHNGEQVCLYEICVCSSETTYANPAFMAKQSILNQLRKMNGGER